MRRDPDPGRTTVSSVQAGKLLALTAEEVRDRIDAGTLPGGRAPKAERDRYYVYDDVPPIRQPPTDAATGYDNELVRLQARVMNLETAGLALLASDELLHQAVEAAAEAAEHARRAQEAQARASALVRQASERKSDAVGVFLVRDHP